jgi:hypothetical protein
MRARNERIFEAASDSDGVGTYGFRLAGVGGELLMTAEPDWPTIEIERRVGSATAREESLSDERACVLFRNGGEVVLERSPGKATFIVPFELGDTELVHPYLAPVAAVFGRWHGWDSFHAGAFVLDGAAFGVIGGRQAGKSSLLAYLALHGRPIVSDDVLLTDGSAVCAGPRAIDLREETASELAAGIAIGKVGTRHRWRMTVAPVAARIRLGGWVFPTWADELAIERLPARELVARLAGHRAVRPAANAGLLLRLAGLPGWELRRPRDWACMPLAAERLCAELAVVGT